ncbi:hypothetical protein YYG_05042 [Plasmodium vinckei petteri]|uniref:CIR protein PIR protein n=1 Tax=Plasmodium vinckei petteri TaxID=138298 RepID=W7AWD3_PLAVN|nr:hypothetical protein YYG_05042 [Plasmodium vinckei petteri]
MFTSKAKSINITTNRSKNTRSTINRLHPTDQQLTPEPQKQDLQYLPQSPNQPADNQQKPSSLSVLEPTLGNNQESSGKSPKDTSSKQADSGNIKLQNILNIVKSTFEMYSSSFYETYNDIRNRLHKSILSAIKNAHTNSIYIANKVIKQVSEQLQKPSTLEKEKNSSSDNKESEPKTPLLHQQINNQKIHNQ